MGTIMLERNAIVPYLAQYNLGETRKNVILYGPPGTGKTSIAVKLRNRGQELYRLTFTSEQSSANMIGFFRPQGDEFVFNDGEGVKAFLGEEKRIREIAGDRTSPVITVHYGGLLVIDEIDKGSPDMLDALYEVGNDRMIACLDLPDGRRVTPQDGFYIVATMNGLPDDLPDPIKDRFPIRIPVWGPGEEQLALLSEPTRRICREAYEKMQGTGLSPDLTFRALRAFDDQVVLGAPPEIAAALVTDAPEQGAALAEKYEQYRTVHNERPLTVPLPEDILADVLIPGTNGHVEIPNEPVPDSREVAPLDGEDLNLGPARTTRRRRI